MKNPLLVLYAIAFFFHALALIGCFLRRRNLEWGSALAAVAANGVLLILIRARSGHWPLFNVFEGLLVVALVLGILGLFFSKPGERLPAVRMWVWIEILILFLIVLLFPKKPSPFLYDHDSLYVVLFHGLRPVALALMLYSSSYFLQFRVDRKRGLSGNEAFHQGRNYLLLSAGLFLAAEYVGIIWCQRGWGDFWRWVGGFFQSTLIVLYLMLAFHLPGKGHRSESLKALIGGMSGFVMLLLVIIRSIPL